MKEIDNTIKILEESKNKRNIKEILNERQYRVEVIEKLRSILLEIRKRNIEIEKKISFKELNKRYKGRIQMAKLAHLYNRAKFPYHSKMMNQIYEDAIKSIDKEYADQFEEFSYIKEEIVCGLESEINNFIKSLYVKYVCEDFGHEYIRCDNSEIVESNAGKMLVAGSREIPVVQCKCCGKKIYEDIFELDFYNKQKILLPINNLNNNKRN